MFNLDKLLEIIGNRKLTFIELAKKMKVRIKNNKDFSRFLNKLEDEGVLFKTNDRKFYAPKLIKEDQGVIQVNPKGFAFVDAEEDSYFIPPFKRSNAMSGDVVKVKVFEDPTRDDAFIGVVIDVIERNRTEFVGRISKNKFGLTIIPFNPTIRGIFIFNKNQTPNIDDEVKVKITEFKGNKLYLDVVKVLGHKDDVSIDIQIAIEDSNLPYEFGEKTVSEARTMPENVDNEDISDREDLRNELIVTIDGDDTKDFDDAIIVKKLDNGNYYLGVHIADVTHYVKEGTALDEEAKIRGNSVYLADRVLPMLPESLSNGICSLNPNVDRLTVSAGMEINSNGKTVNHKIFPSIINSKYRLTYKEVNQFFDGEKSFDNPELEQMLRDALELSHIIRKFKSNEGYVNLEIEESKIIIDEEGKTKDIVPRQRGESEMLIEDFMVRANECVAEHVSSEKLPFIYRVHDKPDSDRIVNLTKVMEILDIPVKIDDEQDPKSFARVVEEIKKSRYDDYIKVMMLRTMAKAVYSDNNIGHFGLASEHYSHFTSPIRRYADLMVHRMLREYYFNNNKKSADHFEAILGSISNHISATEQKAVELERQVADIKKAEFYKGKVGQTYPATIMSVLKFGIFAELDNKVSTLIHVSNMLEGKWTMSDNGLQISNGTTTLTVGQRIDVTIIGANKNEGKIDAVIATDYPALVEMSKKKEK